MGQPPSKKAEAPRPKRENKKVANPPEPDMVTMLFGIDGAAEREERVHAVREALFILLEPIRARNAVLSTKAKRIFEDWERELAQLHHIPVSEHDAMEQGVSTDEIAKQLADRAVARLREAMRRFVDHIAEEWDLDIPKSS